MSGVYARLNIVQEGISNDVTPLGASANSFVNLLPAQLSGWQLQDISTNNASGYFKNPTGGYATTLSEISNTIISECYTAPELTGIISAAAEVAAAKDYFVAHTNRISGVTKIQPSTAIYPHYDTAIALGKSIMYLVAQTDGVHNNSPILACFSSILCANALSQQANTLNTYPAIIRHSISITTINPGDGETYVYSSNLSANQINTIVYNLNATKNMLVDKPTNDVNTYNNYKSVHAEVNQARQFQGMGQTEKYLLQNHIGTEKLLTRLDS